ncbi:hypothetical protein D3C85_1652710 [compost metagenome]
MIALERSRHSNQKCIRRLCLCRRTQITFGDGGMHHHIQFGFDNMDFATVDGIHRPLIDIDANHFLLTGCKYCRSRQTDITQTNNGDSFK